VADKDDVEIGVVVRDVGFGALAGGHEIVRLTLEKRVGGQAVATLARAVVLEPRG
jgi:hypothetical protein